MERIEGKLEPPLSPNLMISLAGPEKGHSIPKSESTREVLQTHDTRV